MFHWMKNSIISLCAALSLTTTVAHANDCYYDSTSQDYYQDQEQDYYQNEGYYDEEVNGECRYCEPEFCEPEAFSAFQLSLYTPVQLYPEDYSIHGIRVNLLYGSNRDVSGLDIGIVNRVNGNMAGVQLGAVNYVNGDFRGCRRGLFNYTGADGYGSESGVVSIARGNFSGWQDSFLANHVGGRMVGIQTTLGYNYASCAKGLQIGAINHTESVTGLQIGLINYTHTLTGVQIGLLNFQTERQYLKVLPIVNVSF